MLANTERLHMQHKASKGQQGEERKEDAKQREAVHFTSTSEKTLSGVSTDGPLISQSLLRRYIKLIKINVAPCLKPLMPKSKRSVWNKHAKRLGKMAEAEGVG